MVKAVCTWGDGEDVLVVLDKTKFLLYENPSMFDRAVHGIVEEGSFFLTKEEAGTLIYELAEAIRACEELEEGLQNYNQRG